MIPCRAPDAHAYGQIGAGSMRRMFRHTVDICRRLAHAPSINWRGSRGGLRPRRGARGAEPARNCEAIKHATDSGTLSGEREGRSRLAIAKQRDLGVAHHPEMKK